ncbi:hypothetical protein ACIQXW_08075 [Lysinibacillus sp. NPDC097162]|uniref:hypothetical protein n=1 Tax=Lysinibacillus sp. NPDC097162 TaxID=3364140 RepID=UPI00380730DD
MQVLFLTLVVISNLFSHTETLPKESTTTICEPITTSDTTLQYPSNHFQSFLVEDEFYKQLDKSIYEEYKDSSFNVRQKILFKEVPDTHKMFTMQTNDNSRKLDLSDHIMIHPNRQVYFLASYRQNEQEEFHKYIVVDAETNNILLGSSTYSAILKADKPL